MFWGMGWGHADEDGDTRMDGAGHFVGSKMVQECEVNPSSFLRAGGCRNALLRI